MLSHMLRAASSKINPSLTYNNYYTASYTGGTTATVTSADLGAANSTRLVVVYVHHNGTATATTFTNLTIAGITATAAVNANNSAQIRAATIFYAAVPTGTTGNIVATVSTSISSTLSCAVYSVYNLTSNTPTTTAVSNNDTSNVSPDSSVTFTPSAEGLFIAGYNAGGVLGGTTASWTNATEDLDTLNGTASFTTASLSNTVNSSTTVSVTLTDTLVNRPNLIAAAWR